MKQITLNLIGIPDNMLLLLKEIKKFEKKLHYFYNEATVMIVLDIVTPRKTKENKKGSKKNKKKELFYSNDLSMDFKSKTEKCAN